MKRVLLKLSGEALAGDKKTGFDEATCIGVAEQVKTACRCRNPGCDCDRRRQLLEGKDERDDRPHESGPDRDAGDNHELYLCI